jgi:hypothetical protein
MDVTLSSGVASRGESRRFHLWMAGLFVVFAFGGFVPTYWAKVVSGTFLMPPVVHIHGALLFSWCLLYFAQSAWIASGRTAMHRAWGTAGIALFTAVICSILVTKVVLMRLDEARGYGEAGRRFSAVAICSLPIMVTLFIAALANVRKPDVHKRLMYSMMCGLMIPAFARVCILLLAPPGALDAGPPPPFVVIAPTTIAAMLIVVGWIHDWRTLGHLHKASVMGGLTVVLGTLAIVPFAYTDVWMRMARALQALGG